MTVSKLLFAIFAVSSVTRGFSKFGCSTDNPSFFGIVFTGFDVSIPDTIEAICGDFSNSTELALGSESAEDLAHITYDPKDDLVYWVVSNADTINRGVVDTNPCFSEVVLNVTGGIVEIDSTNRKLYWGSSSGGLVGVSDLNGDNSAVLYNSSSGADNIIDIRVDPAARMIFWGSSTTSGRIVKGSVDGGNHTVLHSNVEVKCIEVNPTAERVYWITFLTSGSSPATIQSIGYDGDSLDTAFTTINVNLEALDMVFHDGYFYVTTLNYVSQIEVKLFKVEDVRGSVATEIQSSKPYSYLFAEPGIVPPIDSTISLDKDEYSGAEGTNITVQVNRTGNLFRCSAVTLETRDGTATQGKDYKGKRTTIEFPAHSIEKTVEIEILTDDDVETDETFVVALLNASNGILGVNTEAIISIEDTTSIPAPTSTPDTTSTPAPTSTPDPVRGLSVGAQVGIAIAALAIILVVIFAVAFMLHRQNSVKSVNITEANGKEMESQGKSLKQQNGTEEQ